MEYFAFQWHITDECDQRCEHCYIFSGGKTCLTEMSLADMNAVLDNCVDMCRRMKRLPYLYLTGGDPILHPDFWTLLGLLKERDIPFAILGNPFHLSDAVCLRLRSFGCRKYQLSIDGMRETHDWIRKPGSFDATLAAISFIRNAGIDCAIMTTVSATNEAEIEDIIDVVVAHLVDIFAFARFCPGKSDPETHIDPLAYRALLERIWTKFETYRNCGTTFSLKDHLWTLFLHEKGIFKIPEGLAEDRIYDGCHCGDCHMTILPNADVYACRRMESLVGNALQSGLHEIYTSDGMDAFRQYDQFEKCASCELLRFCRGCPAVAFGYTGNMYAADPQCWKQATA